KHIGKRYIERNRRRKILTCERKCFRATKSDKYLEPLFSRKIAKNPRVVDIILNDKEHSVSRLNVLPVILKDFTGIFYGGDGRYGKFQPRPVGSKRTGTDGLSRWPHVRLRQIQSKCTSFAGRASELNFATQQACQFAADREPKARSAVLATRAGI